MILNTTTQVVPGLDTYYDSILLDRGEQINIHGQFGQVRPFKSRSGRTIKFRRYERFDPAMGQLTEGQHGGGKTLTYTDVQATLKQYGDFCAVTDVVTWVNQDPVLTEVMELLGDQYGETADLITRDYLHEGTSVRYANSVAARTDVVTKVVAADLIAIRAFLRDNRGAHFAEPIKAGSGQNTYPIGKAYYALTHTDAEYDIESLTGFRHTFEYASPGQAKLGEFGYAHNFRFCSTNNAKMYADGGGTAVTNTLQYTTANSACDVYTTLFFAKNAYGVVPLEEGNVKSIIHKIGTSGVADPLNQKGTAGWKMMMTAKVLNELWLVRLEHGVGRLGIYSGSGVYTP